VQEGVSALSEQARAYWVTGPGRGEIRTAALPPPAPGQAAVRALYGAVSRGTESLVFRGRVPQSQYRNMRAPHQEGDFPFPVKYGYSSVGRVEAGPGELRGKTVFALHPHQDRYVLDAAALAPLPASVPPARAVLAANMETALNAVWDAGPDYGTAVTVIGAGLVGCLVGYLLRRMAGITVELVDRNPARREIAGALGLDFAASGAARGDRSLLVHASGNPAGLARALQLARFEATILELSWYGDQPVTLPLGEDFHAKRLAIRASQVGSVAPSQRGRLGRRERLAQALALLDDPILDLLIDQESRFEALPETMARLADDCGRVLCHRIVYPGSSGDT